MRGLKSIVVSSITLLALSIAAAKPAPLPPDDHDMVVIVFKDGHHQSFASAQVARIDLKASEEQSTEMAITKNWLRLLIASNSESPL